ncbi:NADPH-dependent FMN reductase [Chitinophaga solisilvae]|uniref:NADPH-dependent FMN reductase n=1 Tax=Chitinophaga solisilvae TaxID=1233460 RepID=UPI00136DD3EF|nr:NADPH-dependent FMN reductase [Chitinophaga solisilvae]
MKVLAICGSTRSVSSNHHIIKAVTTMAAGIFSVELFDGLMNIPPFNPDQDLHAESAPPAVAGFRQLLREADAVLISTPEYAIGVPGVLKNAIDWTVSSMEFSGKPVALITAGTSGHKAHQSLLGTLLIIESRITADAQLVISGVKTKVSDSGTITDPATADSLRRLITALTAVVKEEDIALMPHPTLF